MSNNELEKIQENVLNLDDPKNWYCNVWSYEVDHQMLNIQIKNTNDPARLIDIHFTSVEYFSGAVRWAGANLHIHPQPECMELLLKHRPDLKDIVHYSKETYKPNKSTSYWKLFSILTNEGTIVQIISASSGLVDNMDKPIFTEK